MGLYGASKKTRVVANLVQVVGSAHDVRVALNKLSMLGSAKVAVVGDEVVVGKLNLVKASALVANCRTDCSGARIC